MKVRFYVEKRRSDDGKLLVRNRPIFMTVSFNGHRVVISTGKKVDLQAWDQQQQAVVDTHPESRAINHWLSSLKDTAIVQWNAMASLSENIGASEFREEFERLRPRFSGRFFDVFLLYMDEGAEKWALSNYRKVKTLYKHLVDFEKSENYALSFNTVTEKFLTAFSTYYSKNGKSDTTLWKAVNTLVTFLNWAADQKYNIYSDYKRFYKSLQTSASDHSVPVYLTWEELQIFASYKPFKTVEERVHDLFLFICYTGLRFSEIQRMLKTSILDGYILLEHGKKRPRKITLNEYAEKIVEKYKNRYYPDNAAFPRVSVITMNKYLRNISSELGLRRRVLPNNNDHEVKELCDCITVTTGGNTFIYSALRLGINQDVIGYITGVQKDKRIELIKSEIADAEMKKFNNYRDFQ